ncbi:hypothetical protein CW745_00660 [Psychromonas sp. psych-6C06]|uniref:hypothetical protein n=1 Tax=Psychromonas sp. psych-6C06 TaxID=2058089 RepID=UPI000C3333D8|nr:hypothetical protein [Psychromonas sp. psych-6C06]PKF63393.1 hypothetical protein CW745_00660 [Psychromonas sp. psych-6C06]
MHKLTQVGNDYSLNWKKEFNPCFPAFKFETIKTVFEFAYAMSFAHKGAHRDHRSGGLHHRKNGEIFINAFQGKLSELAVYNYFFQFNRACYEQLSPPDLDVYELSKWDDCDLQLNNQCYSIKSTKYYGDLLLLERQDWDMTGQYIPNLENDKPSHFDYFILVRVKPDGEGMLKQAKCLYSNQVDKQALFELITSEQWVVDVPGYLSHDMLQLLISQQQLIPQGAQLNKKTIMDADNYYVQSGDLCCLKKLISEMKHEL